MSVRSDESYGEMVQSTERLQHEHEALSLHPERHTKSQAWQDAPVMNARAEEMGTGGV